MDTLSNKIGRMFVILTDEDRQLLQRSVLVVDNGYWPYGNLCSTVDRVKQRMPDARITVLTLAGRQGFREEDFPGVEIIFPDPRFRKSKHQLALQMLRLRKKAYTFVVLTSLDKTPIIVALLFSGSRVLLHNRWSEWYAMRFRNLWEYLTLRRGADRRPARWNPCLRALLVVPMAVCRVCVFVYLLFYAAFILFFRKPYYAWKLKLTGGE